MDAAAKHRLVPFADAHQTRLLGKFGNQFLRERRAPAPIPTNDLRSLALRSRAIAERLNQFGKHIFRLPSRTTRATGGYWVGIVPRAALRETIRMVLRHRDGKHPTERRRFPEYKAKSLSDPIPHYRSGGAHGVEVEILASTNFGAFCKESGRHGARFVEVKID